MKTSHHFGRVLIAMLVGISIGAHAEAPVYDADSYPPQQFDGQQPADASSNAPSSTADNSSSVSPEQPTQGPIAADANNGFDPQSSAQDTVPMTLSQRLGRVEQQINNMLHSDASTKMSDLQGELQTLRGQVEDLNHQVQDMQAQQKKLYADLDSRLTQKTPTADTSATDDASANPADGTTPANNASPDTSKPAKKTKTAIAKATANQPNVAEEQQIYQTAYNLIKAKKYNDAASTLQNMLQKYPTGQFAGNAHYWLGQLYSLMGKNDQAVTEFGTVIKNYPDYPKAADAQLKLGLAYSTLMRWSDAKSAFKAVINHYPGTTSAHLASEQLKQIKTSGH